MFHKDILRDRRLYAGLSQEEFAARIGVSKQAVQKWEAGLAVPREKRLRQISDVLKVRMDTIKTYPVEQNSLDGDRMFEIVQDVWQTLNAAQKGRVIDFMQRQKTGRRSRPASPARNRR